MLEAVMMRVNKQFANNCREARILWPNPFLILEILALVISNCLKNKQTLYEKHGLPSRWIIFPQDQIVSSWCSHQV